MDQILAEARQLFDVVIFDMPPVVAVTDAQIMSSKTDGTLLVVRENMSRKESLTKAKNCWIWYKRESLVLYTMGQNTAKMLAITTGIKK